MMDEGSTDNSSAIDTLAADILSPLLSFFKGRLFIISHKQTKNWHETIFKSRKYPGTNQ
jgi:hypothetical protein